MQMFSNLFKIILPRKGTLRLEPRSRNSKTLPMTLGPQHMRLWPKPRHFQSQFLALYQWWDIWFHTTGSCCCSKRMKSQDYQTLLSRKLNGGQNTNIYVWSSSLPSIPCDITTKFQKSSFSNAHNRPDRIRLLVLYWKDIFQVGFFSLQEMVCSTSVPWLKAVKFEMILYYQVRYLFLYSSELFNNQKQLLLTQILEKSLLYLYATELIDLFQVKLASEMEVPPSPGPFFSKGHQLCALVPLGWTRCQHRIQYAKKATWKVRGSQQCTQVRNVEMQASTIIKRL